jgi:tetratricopeptide (TPR) repeat protein
LSAEAECLIGDIAWYAGNQAIADEQLKRALALVDPLPPSRSKAWTLSHASRMTMLAARYDEASSYAHEALELADALALPEIRVSTLVTLGSAHGFMGDIGGIAELEATAALAEQLNSPERARCLNNLATLNITYGRYRAADAALHAAVAAAERFGMRAIGLFSRGNGLYHLYREGRWAEAEHSTTAVLAEAVAAGSRPVEGTALETRALVRLGQDDAAGADADSARFLELGRSIDDRHMIVNAIVVRVTVLARNGRLEEARRLATQLPSYAEGRWLSFPGSTQAVAAARSLGLESVLVTLQSPGAWRTPWQDALEELLIGDPDHAVELYSALEVPKDLAFARLEAAKAHVAAGREEDARVHLVGALEFFRQAGGTPYVAEAEALLAVRAESG